MCEPLHRVDIFCFVITMVLLRIPTAVQPTTGFKYQASDGYGGYQTSAVSFMITFITLTKRVL